jgi:phage repressor protein C with HTH and peptisase S24 domain
MYYIRDMRTLAERLAWAREQKGLTQDALAKLAGVSQGTIGNLESGLRQSARRIVNIASALNVDAVWLAEGRGIPFAASQEEYAANDRGQGIPKEVDQARANSTEQMTSASDRARISPDTSWKHRLVQAREAKGLNLTEFANAVRVSSPTAIDWEKSVTEGGSQEISGIRLTKVCEVLGIDPTWLLNGEGNAPAQTLSPERIEDFKPVSSFGEADPAFVHIPKVRLRVSAGVSGFGVEPEAYDGATAPVPAEWLRRRQLRPERLIAIRVRGRSMEPTFYQDDTVIINQDDIAPVDGAVFVVNYEGEDVIKRLVRDAGNWWLVSDNPNQQHYSRKLCKGAECIIIGRVVRSEREHY